jgi:hypothetical protein
MYPDADPRGPKTYRYGTLVPYIFTSFFEDKKSIRSYKTVENQGCSYYLCLMMEGSGSKSGSLLTANGSGSGSRRPKNIRSYGSGCGSG